MERWKGGKVESEIKKSKISNPITNTRGKKTKAWQFTGKLLNGFGDYSNILLSYLYEC